MSSIGSKNNERVVVRDTPSQVAEDYVDDPMMNKQPLEVYMYYAALERQRERDDPRPIPDSPWTIGWKKLTRRKDTIVVAHERPDLVEESDGLWTLLWKLAFKKRRKDAAFATEKPPATADSIEQLTENEQEKTSRLTAPQELDGHERQPIITERESQSAYLLLRVASWQLVFYMICSDVLGWYTAPMAFRQLGYGPGVMVYTGFFLMAFCSGQILWRMYLNMDSERYPIKCYADLGERTYGPIVRHAFNLLQSIQLLFNVGMLIVMQGQALAEIIGFTFCYLALCIFFALLGMILSQVKTLHGISWLVNVNLWINIIVMCLTMIGVGLYDPVPSQSGHADLSAPVHVSGWVPSYTGGWYQQVVGVQLAVFSYGGAMIFPEFMSEMRRPRDFWKAALAGQALAYSLYMLFGIFVYSWQGQYTNVLPTVNIDNMIFQGVTNILGLICISVIAVLYSHIGCKVFYRSVLRGYLKAPSLTTFRSTFVWSATVVLYWAAAWAIGSAIPNITDLNTIVGASCILQFTYTFPSALLLGHWVQRDALKGDRPWEPGTAPWSNRVDSWKDLSRWKRGLRPYWYAKLAIALLVCAALTLCALGIYSGAMSAEESFAKGFTIAYSCRAPGQPAD